MIRINQNKLKEIKNKEAKEKRATALKEEADVLFFKFQRGEIEKQVWLDKIEEIRNKYPYEE